MKRMCVLCVALFVLVMALPALATETKVMTMGDQHLFIQDDYNIWSFTSTVNNYPRHLIVDHNNTGYSGDSRVGMIVPFMKNAVVGAFFSDDYLPMQYGPTWPGQRLDLFYGYRAATFDLGFHVDWWGYKEEDGPDEQSANAIGIQVGAGFNANGNMLEMDAFYKNFTYTDEFGSPTVVDSADNDDGSNALGVKVRYLWAYNNMVTLVPAVSVQQWKDKNLAGEEAKWTSADVGIGCNTVPLQGTEFLTSVGVDLESWKETDGGVTNEDESWKALPYVKFGADIQVKPWLNLRVGAQKWLVTYEDKSDPADVYKESYPDFEYNLGAAIMLGDVQFDVELNKDWLNSGPYFLSGEDPSGSDMFPKVSFKYDYR